MEPNLPKVGVALLVEKKGKFLFGKRKGSHGAGAWAPPGGHLEMEEGWESCAARELKEETGMRTTGPLMFAGATNDLFSEEKHYVTIFLHAATEDEPELLEPDKCEKWDWFSWNELPSPLFMPVENLIKNGFNPSIV